MNVENNHTAEEKEQTKNGRETITIHTTLGDEGLSSSQLNQVWNVYRLLRLGLVNFLHRELLLAALAALACSAAGLSRFWVPTVSGVFRRFRETGVCATAQTNHWNYSSRWQGMCLWFLDDVHKCGRCQSEFSTLETFIQHKLQHCCKRAEARETGQDASQEVRAELLGFE